MMETDETGNWIDVLYKDADTDHNTNGTMFTDFIEPEFTYEYSETTIDYTGKTLTTIFYVADKYFDNANSSLALSDLDIRVDGEQIVSDDGTNTFTEEAYNDADGNRIGTKYTLVIKNLPRTTGAPYNDYSGPVSITIPANKIADLSGNKNLAKTITIGIDDPENDPNHNTEQITIIGDERLLCRAIQNIISNSINHNENGCIISVRLEINGNNLELVISDNGKGISEKELQKIQSTPHYLQSTDNRLDLRHGLGLLLVKEIISIHKGTVSISSALNKGFSTTISLPINNQ